jgi:predicted HD phosphohydrolase
MEEPMANPALINDIDQLFGRHGDRPYDGRGTEPLTILQHALHCAQLAEWADADESLVAACVLHGTSQMLGDATGESSDDRALAWLADGFGPEVLEPIRLQSAARRYLHATDADFRGTLASETPMSLAEQLEFDATPQSARALQLARLILQAQTPIERVPPLDYYLALLEDLQRQSADRDKVEVGPQTVT